MTGVEIHLDVSHFCVNVVEKFLYAVCKIMGCIKRKIKEVKKMGKSSVEKIR